MQPNCKHKSRSRNLVTYMLVLDQYSRLPERGSDLRTELRAGLATFLTMAYIAFVNPQILDDAGMPFEGGLRRDLRRRGDQHSHHGPLRQIPRGAGSGHGPERILQLCRRTRAGISLGSRPRRGVRLRRPVRRAERTASTALDHRRHPVRTEDGDLGGHRVFPRHHRAQERRHHHREPRHPGDLRRSAGSRSHSCAARLFA